MNPASAPGRAPSSVLLTQLGDVEVALDADLVAVVLASEPAAEVAGLVDLAVVLGVRVTGAARRVVGIQVGATVRWVLVGAEVSVQPLADGVLDVPPLVAGVARRLGLAGLIPAGDGFQFLLDARSLLAKAELETR